MKHLILSVLAIFCLSNVAQASHISSMELTYEYISGNDYLVKLRLARDCSGIGLGATTSASYGSASLNQSATFTMNQTNVYFMSGYCVTAASQCVNPSSPYLGYEVHEYEATVTLPAAAADWQFIWTSCCRNAAILNIGTASATVIATLDNLNTPINNSVRYPNPFQLTYEVNQPYNLSFAPTDPDNDSLDVQFITPYNMSNGPMAAPSPYVWNTGYSLAQPFPSTGPIVLNSSNGNISFQASVQGTYVIAMQVDEYRNGIIVGSTVRDLQLTFYAGTSNNLPDITGASVSNVYVTDICPSSSLSIPFTTTDADITDSTFLWWDTTITGATFTVTPGQNETGVFNWTPTAADVSPIPYLVTFAVRDNNCPVQGYRAYTYQIYVTQCNPDSVWAGDANGDFTADNYDVLAIGVANGSTGPLRPNATTSWQAEWCAPWANSFVNNINYKHADCNGDGTVDAADLTAVSANYGMIHFKQGNIGQYKTAGLPDLKINKSGIQMLAGNTVSLPMELGNTSSLMNDFYGLSATVELINAQTSAPISITNTNSWIGNNLSMFTFEKSLAANKVAFTLVGNTGQNITGQGQIGTIEFPIDVSSVGGSEVIVQFSDVKIIKNNGEEINDYNVLQDTLTILSPQSVSSLGEETEISIYPNPVQKELNIKLTLAESDTYQATLYDQVGRVIKENVINEKLSVGEHHLSIDISSLPSSIYFLKVTNSIGSETISFGKY